MLFDDIEPELCLADKSEFSSSAEAQAFLTNKVFDWFSDLNVVLFCPTGMICTGYLKGQRPKMFCYKTLIPLKF